MHEQTSLDRRLLLGTSSMTLAAAPFTVSGDTFAQTGGIAERARSAS